MSESGHKSLSHAWEELTALQLAGHERQQPMHLTVEVRSSSTSAPTCIEHPGHTHAARSQATQPGCGRKKTFALVHVFVCELHSCGSVDQHSESKLQAFEGLRHGSSLSLRSWTDAKRNKEDRKDKGHTALAMGMTGHSVRTDRNKSRFWLVVNWDGKYLTVSSCSN